MSIYLNLILIFVTTSATHFKILDVDKPFYSYIFSRNLYITIYQINSTFQWQAKQGIFTFGACYWNSHYIISPLLNTTK